MRVTNVAVCGSDDLPKCNVAFLVSLEDISLHLLKSDCSFRPRTVSWRESKSYRLLVKLRLTVVS